MTRAKRKEIEAIVAAQIAEWSTKSAEERMMIHREQMERQQKLEDERDGKVSSEFEKVLAGLREITSCVEVMSRESYERHVWSTDTAPAMAAAGIDQRHRRRITEWGCKPQQRVFEEVKKRCVGVGAVIALVGNRGTGKTTIPIQLMRERIEAERAWYMASEEERQTMPRVREPGRYVKLMRLGSMFKPLYADFGSTKTEQLSSMLSAWVRLPFLVIDEVHEVDDLRTQDRLLVDIIDRRYANRKDTVLIGNLDAAAFQRTTNPSIISRIAEHGKIIPCEWASFRTPKDQ